MKKFKKFKKNEKNKHSKSDFLCYNYNKSEHLVKNCRKSKKVSSLSVSSKNQILTS